MRVCIVMIINYLKVFKDAVIKMISNNIFWNALGSIASALAVMISLYQSNNLNRRKLKLTLDYALTFNGIKNGVPKEYLTINIMNISEMDIFIKEWSIKLNKKQRLYLIIDGALKGSDNKIRRDKSTFQVKPGEDITLFYDYSLFIKNITKYLNEGKLNKYLKITFYITDNFNKRYKIKSKSNLKNILDSKNDIKI